jgi:hypothetical protein
MALDANARLSRNTELERLYRKKYPKKFLHRDKLAEYIKKLRAEGLMCDPHLGIYPDTAMQNPYEQDPYLRFLTDRAAEEANAQQDEDFRIIGILRPKWDAEKIVQGMELDYQRRTYYERKARQQVLRTNARMINRAMDEVRQDIRRRRRLEYMAETITRVADELKQRPHLGFFDELGGFHRR